jgi:Zn-dependent protease with chaperone function
MKRYFVRAAVLVAVFVLAVAGPGAASAQTQKPAFWDVEQAASLTSTSVRLNRPGASGDAVETVPMARIRMIRDVKRRIEKESGISASFSLTDLGMPSANAYSTRTDKGNAVGINLAMVRLLADDVDAYAAVIGHEFAHLALNHRDARTERESARQGISSVLGFVLGMAGVPMAGTLTSLGTSIVSRTFSRDEERDADEKGMAYAASAGFSAEGGVRAWERMSRSGSSASIPFLSTHPAPAERLETMRKVALAYPQRAPAPVDKEAFDAVTRWSFSGREMLKWRGIVFADDSDGVRVLDIATETQTALKIGDLAKTCSRTAGAIESVAALAGCYEASKGRVLQLDILREGEPSRIETLDVTPAPVLIPNNR